MEETELYDKVTKLLKDDSRIVSKGRLVLDLINRDPFEEPNIYVARMYCEGRVNPKEWGDALTSDLEGVTCHSVDPEEVKLVRLYDGNEVEHVYVNICGVK